MTSLRSAVAVSARAVLTIGLIGSVVAAISVGLHFERQGDHILSVQTNSMVPIFKPGDAVLVRRQPADGLRVGDIVSYHSLLDPKVIVSHRIVAINTQQGWLRTKGDRLQTADPTITTQAVIGQVWAVAPRLGRLLGWLSQPVALLIVVYIPALGLILVQVRRVLGYYKNASYRLYERQ
jgi:signal peptidase I